MKKFIGVAFLCFLLFNAGCSSQPKGFTYKYEPDNNLGLDTLINIQGYYIFNSGCDTTNYAIIMFYSNGLFTVANDDGKYGLKKDLLNCFQYGGTVDICKYPDWGIYEIKQDTIKTQSIKDFGVYGTIVRYRDFIITPAKELQNISDYKYEHLKSKEVGGNFYFENSCPKPAEFHPSESKRDTLICPWLKKKWFFEDNKKSK